MSFRLTYYWHTPLYFLLFITIKRGGFIDQHDVVQLIIQLSCFFVKYDREHNGLKGRTASAWTVCGEYREAF